MTSTLTDLHKILKGGSGSGNFGHAGRPGKRGGSSPGKGSSNSNGGVEIKATAVRLDSRSRTIVESDLLDSYGNKVGRLEYTKDPSTKSASIDLLKLDSSVQSQGLGQSVMRSLESDLRAEDYKTMRTTATHKGSWFWAKNGYDFRDATDLKTITESYERAYDSRYGSLPKSSALPRTAQEFVNAKGPDGFNIGREAFLNETWNGIKKL